MRIQIIRYLFGSFLLLLLMFAATMSYAVTAASGTPPTTGANFLNGMGASEKGDSTAPLPFYLFNIYLSTANWWSCSNCNGEQSSLLLPVVGGSTVPPGKYLVTMSVVMNQLDTNGRWVKLSGPKNF